MSTIHCPHCQHHDPLATYPVVRSYWRLITKLRQTERSLNHFLSLSPQWAKKEIETQHKAIATIREITTDRITKAIQQLRFTNWLTSIRGLGLNFATAILAEIYFPKLKHASQLWTFSGLDPNAKRRMRFHRHIHYMLCTKILNSFLAHYDQNSDDPSCPYAKIYFSFLHKISEQNNQLAYAKYCHNKIQNAHIHPHTTSYSYYQKGLLPPAQITARARRYTAKILLQHIFHVAYFDLHNKEPDPPFPKKINPNASIIPPPNFSPNSYLLISGCPLKSFYPPP